METRKIKLTIDTASRWINSDNAELKELALTTFLELGKKALPKSWEELEKINGVFINVDSTISNNYSRKTNVYNRNVFATREQAEASIALAQLSQLMKVYNGDWVADWDNDTYKYIIEYFTNKINKDCYISTQRFLAFKDAETRDLFLENFRELILTAKPLL